MRRLRALERLPGGRALMGVLATLGMTLRLRTPYTVRERDGVWVHTSLGETWVTPDFSLPPIARAGASGFRAQVRNLQSLSPDHERADDLAGATVVDIGAGMGSMVQIAARLVGPAGRVVACEAHPRTLAGLEALCRANRFDNVMRCGVAIAASEGTVRIEEDGDWEKLRSAVDEGIEVEATTVDRLVERHGLERVDLLIMNIEGAERPAFEGMRETLQRTRRVAIACHDFRAEQEGLEEMRTKAFVVDALRDAGFRLATPARAGADAAADWVFGDNTALVDGDTGPGDRWPASMILAMTSEPAERLEPR